MPNQLTDEQKNMTDEQKLAQWEQWATMPNYEDFKDCLSRLKIGFTEHQCKGAIQTGGTPIREGAGLLGDKITWKDKEQKQYEKFIMLDPVLGDAGNVFFYFDVDNNFVTRRVYVNK